MNEFPKHNKLLTCQEVNILLSESNDSFINLSFQSYLTSNWYECSQKPCKYSIGEDLTIQIGI